MVMVMVMVMGMVITRAQVTADPETLAPTNQLDSRALAWLQSLGSEVSILLDHSQVKKKNTIDLMSSRKLWAHEVLYTHSEIHPIRPIHALIAPLHPSVVFFCLPIVIEQKNLECKIIGDYSRTRTLNWGKYLLQSLFDLRWAAHTLHSFLQELKSSSFWPVVETAIQVAYATIPTKPACPISRPQLLSFKALPRGRGGLTKVNSLFCTFHLKYRLYLLVQEGIERANQRAISNVATIKRWTLLTRSLIIQMQQFCRKKTKLSIEHYTVYCITWGCWYDDEQS